MGDHGVSCIFRERRQRISPSFGMTFRRSQRVRKRVNMKGTVVMAAAAVEVTRIRAAELQRECVESCGEMIFLRIRRLIGDRRNHPLSPRNKLHFITMNLM